MGHYVRGPRCPHCGWEMVVVAVRRLRPRSVSYAWRVQCWNGPIDGHPEAGCPRFGIAVDPEEIFNLARAKKKAAEA